LQAIRRGNRNGVERVFGEAKLRSSPVSNRGSHVDHSTAESWPRRSPRGWWTRW
jgi:hypothetical protein